MLKKIFNLGSRPIIKCMGHTLPSGEFTRIGIVIKDED